MISIIDNGLCLLTLWGKKTRLMNVTRSEVVIQVEEQCEDIFTCDRT